MMLGTTFASPYASPRSPVPSAAPTTGSRSIPVSREATVPPAIARLERRTDS